MSKKRKKKNGNAVTVSKAVNSQKSETLTDIVAVERAYFSAPRLRSFAVSSSQKADNGLATSALLSRRGSDEDEDAFSRYYGPNGLLVEPPFPFEWLWSLYQECDTLNLCCHSMVDNCENLIDFVWEGEKGEDSGDTQKAQRIMLRDFFSRVNEKDSFLDLRKKIRLDREVTGNAFVEVIRDKNLEKDVQGNWALKPKPERLYYIPSTHMRVTYLQDAYPVTVMLPRAGKMIPVTIAQRFRKFARKNPHTNEIIWFKEFGDPRVMDSTNGEYVDSIEKTNSPATEIWWFRDNYAGSVYGIPKWLAVVWDVSARYQAKWINFDHLDQGAIPPGFFATEGGKLTTASKQALDHILEEIRDPKYFNRFIHLEVTPDLSLDFNANSSSTPKLKYFKLRDPQHEDLMNKEFLKTTKEDIREVFRIPPVLAGVAGNDTFASAYVSMEVAESQVFEPQKEAFDGKVTTELIQNEFGIYQWRIKTRQSKIGDKETFYKAVGALTRAGLLTINDGRELANQLLGTSLPAFDGSEVYKEPMGLVNRLVDAGLVTFDEGTEALQFTEPMLEVAAAIKSMKSEKGKKSEGKVSRGNNRKTTDALAQQLIKALVEIENQIEKGEYSPPEIDEQDYVL